MFVNLLIFKKIKEGDIKAFETLFRSCYEPLCRYAFRFVENMETAEEIVQDLFYVIWKERQNLQILTSVNGYLYRAVKNKSLQYLEQARVRDDYRKMYVENANMETITPQEELEYKELEQQIQETLHHLPDRRQRIFHMNRMEGKKYSEIAAELQISVKTVEAEITKTLRELRNKYHSIYHYNNQRSNIHAHETAQ